MKYFTKMRYFSLILWLSLKSIPRVNLGDTVKYDGKLYVLTQGVMNPKWNLSGNGEYLENIHRDLFRKRYSLSDCIWSFKHSYTFYMQNWYGIWCRNGIEDWMKRCNIWQNK